jgi:hypothetical protein
MVRERQERAGADAAWLRGSVIAGRLAREVG